jgi:hypothetical protein
MLKFARGLLLFSLFSTLFWAGAAGAGQDLGADGDDATAVMARAQAEPDPEAAFSLYCQAAKLGSGPAQLHVGQVLAGGEKGDAPFMAAGMLWLDMAILNGVPEAREARRKAGRLAAPEDFTKYRAYNNRRMELPCVPEDEAENGASE